MEGERALRSMVLLEVCIDSRAGLESAVKGRAARLEVCSRLDLGGLTPDDELLRAAIDTGIPCVAMIRPRGGDFVYSRAEKARMLAEIERVTRFRPQGIVTGALTPSAEIDRDLMTSVMSLARPLRDRTRIDSPVSQIKLAPLRGAEASNSSQPLTVTFHRAFDHAKDAHAALEALVALGVDRVLTSGGASDAYVGRMALRELVARANDRISILAGGGVRAHNALEIVRASGVTELHSSTVFDAP